MATKTKKTTKTMTEKTYRCGYCLKYKTANRMAFVAVVNSSKSCCKVCGNA